MLPSEIYRQDLCYKNTWSIYSEVITPQVVAVDGAIVFLFLEKKDYPRPLHQSDACSPFIKQSIRKVWDPKQARLAEKN